MSFTVNQMRKRLDALVKKDPSIGKLPIYCNSPMDDLYAYSVAHSSAIFAGEVHVVKASADAFVDRDNADDCAEEEESTVHDVRAVVIDTH